MLAERFLDERRLLGARFDFPHFALEADRRRDFERPLDALRFFEQLLLRDLLRLREPPRFPDLLRLREPPRFPDLLRLREPPRFPDLLRLREPPRFPDLLRLRDPERFPEQLRFLERLRDLRPLEAERLLLPLEFDRAFEQDFERDRDRFCMAAFFMAAFLFGQEGLLGLLQFLLWFCSSSSIAASLDRDLLPAIVNGKLFQPLKIYRKS